MDGGISITQLCCFRSVRPAPGVHRQGGVWNVISANSPTQQRTVMLVAVTNDLFGVIYFTYPHGVNRFESHRLVPVINGTKWKD